MRANLRVGLAVPVILLMVLTLSCTGGPAAGTSAQRTSSPTTSVQTDAPECVVILLDGTGSYNNLPRAAQIASQIPCALPGGSVLYVRWITANSISDEASILSATIPAAPPQILNPFDPRQKLAFARSQVKRQEVLTDIVQVLNSVHPPKPPYHDNYTDIEGALQAAADRYSEHSNLAPELVIFSDLVENAHIAFKRLSLRNVDVVVLGFQVTGPEAERVKADWVAKFRKLGAKSVTFRYLDDPSVRALLRRPS